MLTDEELKEIKDRLAKVDTDNWHFICDASLRTISFNREEQDFLTHMPNNVTALIAEVEWLREIVAAYLSLDEDKALGLFQKQVERIIKTLLEEYVPSGYLTMGSEQRARSYIVAAALKLHEWLSDAEAAKLLKGFTPENLASIQRELNGEGE